MNQKNRLLENVQFTRFIGGKLETVPWDPNGFQYLAISHVWGDPSLYDFRELSNSAIGRKVKCTEQKARFIEEQLFNHVGDLPFWMDILSVDQTDKAAVTAVTQSIPAIFRGAMKTIAIQEPDGFYSCCREALKDMETFKDLASCFLNHAEKEHGKGGHWFWESFMQRLWTLEECLLSPVIQFVTYARNTPEPDRVERDPATHWYKTQLNMRIICDMLWQLACCSSVGGLTNTDHIYIDEFLKAYIHCGTIKNPPRTEGFEEDIHTPWKLADTGVSISTREILLSSQRRSTKARDYVLATMPQYSWYTVPATAKDWSFSAMFADLCEQAFVSGHGFAYKFCNSMTDKNAMSDPQQAWLPSRRQAIPQCLGDFLKLMGRASATRPSLEDEYLHMTTIAEVWEWEPDHDPDVWLDAIEQTMSWSNQYFAEMDIAGELCKYGNFPEEEFNHDDADILDFGWFCANRQHKREPPTLIDLIQNLESTSFERHGVRVADWSQEEKRKLGFQIPALLEELREGPEFANEFRESDDFPPGFSDEHIAHQDAGEKDYYAQQNSKATLLQQAHQILSHMWGAQEQNPSISASQRSDWKVFRRTVRRRWPEYMVRAVMLLAALVACGIGTSALRWANHHFVPVYIKLGDKTLVGLLARHMRAIPGKRGEPRPLISAGRHVEGRARDARDMGMDIMLVDPVTKLPVGLVPEFPRSSFALVSDEVFQEKMSTLYAGTSQSLPGGKVAFRMISLKKLGKFKGAP